MLIANVIATNSKQKAIKQRIKRFIFRQSVARTDEHQGRQRSTLAATPKDALIEGHEQAIQNRTVGIEKFVKEHEIKPERILGHSDIAPGRNVDPGPRFPWKQFADAGLILWPDANLVAIKRAGYEQLLPDVAWFQQKLSQHGFAVPLNGELDKRTQETLSAFQMKYRQSRFDGVPDAETAALLDVITTPPAPTQPKS